MDQDQGRCARLVEGSYCYVEAACRLAGTVDHCADHYACREGREGMAHFSPYHQAAGTAGPCRAASTDRDHQGRQETVLARLSLCRWEGMVVHQAGCFVQHHQGAGTAAHYEEAEAARPNHLR